MQAQEYHENLADILRRISKELKVEPKDILDIVKKPLNPEELGKKERQLESLEKEKTDLQAKLSWVQRELATAK